MRYILLFLISFPAMAQNFGGSIEIEDLQGTTTHFTGTVGTTITALPTVAGNIISEVMFQCPTQTPRTNRCKISFDGGTGFFTLRPGTIIAWSAKGEIKQIHIQGNVAGVSYDIMMNRESW